MSVLPFLALYVGIVFVPLYAAVRDLMVHQIRIERARAILGLVTRDGAQVAILNERGQLEGIPEQMEAQVREGWGRARIPGAALEAVSCQALPPRCEAGAVVTTRGLLGTLRAWVYAEATVLQGIVRENE